MSTSAYNGPARGLKSIRVGRFGFIRQHDMTFWYFWGKRCFDIRDLREKLGLPTQDATLDNYFRGEGKQYALAQVHQNLNEAASKTNQTLSQHISALLG
jgi:hypothetical protein